MYIIEMHHRQRAFSQIIMEKGDASKTYDDLSKFKVIINHSGDVDERSCNWCAIHRRTELKRERESQKGGVIHVGSHNP